MDRNVLVQVNLLGSPNLVGRLWARTRRDEEGATFQYADGDEAFRMLAANVYVLVAQDGSR